MTTGGWDLPELEVRRALKLRMPRPGGDLNVSPFDDRVMTAQGTVGGYDLAGVHAEVRDRIRQTITAVRDGDLKSQVVLLSGDAGTGKTHLLQSFRNAEQAEQCGYVFAGGSNHWSVGEFEARLLDWLIEAVTDPTPSEDHLLLERVRSIGFRAVGHLLDAPVHWRTYVARPARSWFGRFLGRGRKIRYETLKALADASNPEVFKYLDFARFSEYVCDRFLAEKANPTHRYALRVLLLYLFPEREETGIGTRERVAQWFRGREDAEYFGRRLGASDHLDRHFAQFDAVKLLVHLFSPAVSAKLATADRPCPPKVFLLVFDQAEGRNELFDGDADWRDFFAQLSELYNSLPNVVVLFTMTLGLRHKLHAIMERQFQDRIRMDEKFLLGSPETAQVLDRYRSRVENWVRSDAELLSQYLGLENPYVPLTREKVLEVAGRQPLRATLAGLDSAFRNEMLGGVDTTPLLDFLHFVREQRPTETTQTEWDYTLNHATTVVRVLETAARVMCPDVCVAGVEEVEVEDTRVLKVRFARASGGENIYVYIARLGFVYTEKSVKIINESLANRTKARHFLWIVRPNVNNPAVPRAYKDQVFARLLPPSVETALRGVLHIAGKKDAGADYMVAADQVIRGELAKTYLGELLKDVGQRFAAPLGPAEPEPAKAAH